MSKYKYPEGAIKSVEEFRCLVRDKKFEVVYFAGSALIKEPIKDIEPMRVVESPRKYGLTVEFEFTKGSAWWTYPQEFCFLEDEEQGIEGGVFFAFTNYWHAYAFHRQSLRKLDHE